MACNEHTAIITRVACYSRFTDFQLIFFRSASVTVPSKKVQLTQIGSRQHALQST